MECIEKEVGDNSFSLCFFKRWVMKTYSGGGAEKSEFSKCYFSCDGHNHHCVDYLVREDFPEKVKE